MAMRLREQLLAGSMGVAPANLPGARQM